MKFVEVAINLLLLFRISSLFYECDKQKQEKRAYVIKHFCRVVPTSVYDTYELATIRNKYAIQF